MNRPVSSSQSGFTLIEILLVITLMAVVSAVIVPSFFSASGSTPAQEARLMQKMLRMASEESQLTGRPLLLLVFPDHLSLRSRNQKGRWQPIISDVLDATYRLPAPVRIARAALDGDVMLSLPGIDHNTTSRKEAVPMARFLLMPDGNLTTGSITLHAGRGTDSVVLRLQPGPGGIKLEQ